MYFLSTGQSSFKLEVVKSHGKNPGKRYQHSMSYDDLNNYLIVYGGRNDELLDDYCLGDIWIFNCETLCWFMARQSGPQALPRYSHSAFA
mmetsp:Transcript_63635/g.53963  ORF Transcript_63635/g.53963 Transcript_63635/m.53963 type:complete len:90 (+) Transcript_63635:886-1155(+)